MKSAFLPAAATGLALVLAGCATKGDRGPQPPGIDVGRFHLGQTTIARSNIAIEPFDRADASRPGYPAYAAAIGRELTRLGWTVVPSTAQSEQIALIDVEQGSPAAIGALSAARIGRGVVSPAHAGSSGNVTATLLEVAIRRRSDATVFWEGRAVAEAPTGSAAAAPTAAAERLAAALFRDFPGESGRIITVR
ncbi:MAG TPA: DUF4136 domain-containing protein [Allosphingosinicella sp.]|jgi:hypothetical protein